MAIEINIPKPIIDYNDLENKPTIPSVAGATGEIQFNSGGVFGASSKLKFANDTLTVQGLISSQGATKTQDAAENAIVDINNFVFSPRGTTNDISNGLRIKGTINFDAFNQVGRGLFIDIASNATPSQLVRPIEINWAGNLTTISRISNSSMEASSGTMLEIVRGSSGFTGQRMTLSGRSPSPFMSKGVIFQDYELPNYWAVGTLDSSYLRFFHNSGSAAAGAVNPTMWLKDKRVGIGQYAPFNPQATLHIKGEGSTSATATQIWQNASNVELMRVSDNGDVLYGLVAPGKIRITSAGVIGFDRGTGDYGSAQIYSPGNNQLYINARVLITIGVNGDKMRIGETNSTMVVPLRLSNGGSVFSAPAASAIADFDSTTQGLLPPRMTTTQKNAITSPATGLVVYDNTTNKLCCFNGSTWNDLF